MQKLEDIIMNIVCLALLIGGLLYVVFHYYMALFAAR